MMIQSFGPITAKDTKSYEPLPIGQILTATFMACESTLCVLQLIDVPYHRGISEGFQTGHE